MTFDGVLQVFCRFGAGEYVGFTPKYRRKIDYCGMREDIRGIIRDLCKWKGAAILEGKVMPDHIHLLLSIPPKYSVSSFMGYLKGKSAMRIFERATRKFEV